MYRLERLRTDHALAVLDFERVNRAYFAASVSDRGDQFFDQFVDRFDVLLADQEAGICGFYVLVDDDGSVVGRFNLYDIDDGSADVGYRVAQHVANRGVATEALRELCRIATDRHGLRTLRAATSHDNLGSQKVLTNAGFAPVGPAAPAEIGGRSGTSYRLDRQPANPGLAGGPTAEAAPSKLHDPEDDRTVEMPTMLVQEQEVARIWAEVLGLPEADANTNFFDLGGHSLLLMELVSQFSQKLGITTDVIMLMEYPTIAGFTEYWNSQEFAGDSSE